MDVRTLAAPVRDSYVKAFERAVREFKVNRNRHCLLEYDAGESVAAEEGMLSLPMRHDLLPLVDGRPEAITVVRESTPARVTDTVIEVGNIPVTFKQFTWDHFELRAFGVKGKKDLSPLVLWFDRWFDRVGRRPELAGGVRGVVHSLAGPFWNDNGMTFEVDLGTATSDALVDLLHAVSHLAPVAMEVISPASRPNRTPPWDIIVPDGWEKLDEAPGQPSTYVKGESTYRVAVQEGAALNRNTNEKDLADAIRELAMRSGARKTAHVLGGICPLGLYAVMEWRTLEHGTIRLWMLTNHRDIVTASLIGDDLTEREIRLMTECVMAIAPKP